MQAALTLGGTACAAEGKTWLLKIVLIESMDSGRRVLVLGAVALLAASCAKKKRIRAPAPLAPTPGTVEHGIASWYGYPYHGRRSASGEIYDMEKLTAAHRTLPFGCWVEVTNLSNGRQVRVRITDRGPFVEGRIIDLSFAAAQELDMVNQGVARVSVEIIEYVTEVYHVQVGAFGLETNAARARKILEEAGFVVATERTSFGVTRVLASGFVQKDLPEAQKRLEALGFTDLLVKKETVEARQPSPQ